MKAQLRRAASVGAGLALVSALAFLVAPLASSEPDGLDRVAIDHGFDDAERPHALEDAPTAGYALRGVDDEGLSTGLAGVIGVSITFVVSGGVLAWSRRAAGRRRSVEQL